MNRIIGNSVSDQLRWLADFIEREKPETRAFAAVVVEQTERAAWVGSVNEGETPATMLVLLHKHKTFAGEPSIKPKPEGA